MYDEPVHHEPTQEDINKAEIELATRLQHAAEDDLASRLRLYTLPQRKLMHVLYAWTGEPLVTVEQPWDLPADFKLISVHYNHEYLCFDLTIQSSTFDPVPIGCVIPRFPDLYFHTELHQYVNVKVIDECLKASLDPDTITEIQAFQKQLDKIIKSKKT